MKALIRNFDEFNQDKEFVRKPARKMQLEDFLNKLKMIKGLLQLKIMMLNIQHEYADLVSEDFESSDDSYSPACKVHNYRLLIKKSLSKKSIMDCESLRQKLVKNSQ